MPTSSDRPTKNPHLLAWVEEMAKLCKPDRVYWCDGSEAEQKRLTEEAVASKVLIPLDQKKWPGCYYHHSNPNDVARVEHLTFICTPTREEAGPTNNWMEPGEAYRKLSAMYQGAMKGRTMYVVPFLMGPVGSRFSKVGVEITDSRYVVLNMRIMTRMGKVALDTLGASSDFCKGLHSLGDLSPDRRFICHFPG
ncbi:MAG TPA: phosphoenolpyruvate carboxykinase, partial [Anaeromyxobacter sp.]|nr:phosphoenolpyruvate carboxykinase [Anaeromyxobacter sp.]